MGQKRIKTKYFEPGNYGSTIEKTLYATISRSTDLVTIYDEDNNIILVCDDTMDNNIIDAINRLYRGEGENI